ncbi:MAG: Clp1/GlmU family protein [Acidimicrobiia bacterium]
MQRKVPRVSHAEFVDHLLEKRGTVVLLGGLDTGKTTFGLSLASKAGDKDIPTAYVDADVGQSTIGPPTTVGLKYITNLEKVDRDTVRVADELAFVGSTTPRGHLVSLTAGTGRLVQHAKDAGCELIVVDTSGFISGIQAELLKYYKIELIRPDAIVGFERGWELDPIGGIVQRFFPSEATILKAEGLAAERSVEERLAYREERLKEYFKPPVSRWRVKTSVFMPTIPPETDLSRLDGIVVGLEDGKGNCLGIGLLEYDSEEDILRMVSPIAEGAKGLLLGSVRLNLEGQTIGTVTLEELFGSG